MHSWAVFFPRWNRACPDGSQGMASTSHTGVPPDSYRGYRGDASPFLHPDRWYGASSRNKFGTGNDRWKENI